MAGVLCTEHVKDMSGPMALFSSLSTKLHQLAGKCIPNTLRWNRGESVLSFLLIAGLATLPIYQSPLWFGTDYLGMLKADDEAPFERGLVLLILTVCPR